MDAIREDRTDMGFSLLFAPRAIISPGELPGKSQNIAGMGFEWI
jgi:hypothetical protein